MVDTNPGQQTPSIRAEQAQMVTNRIIAAAIAQIEAGTEPSMRAVAIRARIAERTLYRYFPSLEALQAATMPHLRRLVGYPMCNTADELPVYVKQLFTRFQSSSALSRVLATAPWAAPILRQTRTESRDRLLDVLKAAFPDVPRADIESATAGLRVPLSAAGWIYLEDCGYDLRASIRHVQWLVKTVLDHLQHLQEKKHA